MLSFTIDTMKDSPADPSIHILQCGSMRSHLHWWRWRWRWRGGDQCRGWEWSLAQGCLLGGGQDIAPVGCIWSQANHISGDQRNISGQFCSNGSTLGRGITCCCLIHTLESKVKLSQIGTSGKLCSESHSSRLTIGRTPSIHIYKHIYSVMIHDNTSTYRR